MTRKSPYHNRDMHGEEMFMCPACGTWYKAEDLDNATLDSMLKMFGLSPKKNP